MLIKINILMIILSLSCSDKDFDSVVGEVAQGSADQVPDVPKVVAESMPPIELEPQPFTLNPSGDARVTEQINLSQNNTVNKNIVMATEKAPKQYTVTAKSRAWHSRQVTQTGNSGTTRTDTFARATHKGLLDLLLVIDDSKSMSTVHGYLVAGLSNLLNSISNSNWQIKVIDVDDSNMCDHTIINENNKSHFTTLLTNFSANPNKNERALQKAKAALGITGSCGSWLRTDSTLAAVIVTDEDYQCSNASAADNRGSDDNSFYCGTQVGDFITAFKGLRTNTGLYGIFDDQATCGALRTKYAGTTCFATNSTHIDNYGQVLCPITNPCYGRDNNYKFRSANYLAGSFDMTSYVRSDKAGYASILGSISAGIKAKLDDQFTLTHEPDSGAAVTVTVNGKSTSNFKTSSNILTLYDAGNANDAIAVTYVPNGGVKPFKNTLTVDDSQADMNTVSVTVGGKTLAKNTHYTVNGNTITINNVKTNFPSGATAALRWQKQTSYDPKQNDFRFGGNHEIVAGTVSIDGYAASRYTFYASPNRVNFNSGQEPAYGASLTIRYSAYNNNVLKYPINYSGTYPVTAVSCSPVACSRSGNNIVFSPSDFQRGKSVVVTLTVQGLQSDRRPVPQHYVAGTLELELDSKKCVEKELVIASGELMLVTNNATNNDCDMLEDLRSNINQNITLSYLPFTFKQEIEVGTENLLEYAGYKTEIWEVYVASQKKEKDKDYTVSGRKITLKGNYPPNTKGEVRIFIKY